MQAKTLNSAVDVLLICALKDEYDQVIEVTDGLLDTEWEKKTLPDGWLVADGCFHTPSGIPLIIRTTHANHMGREKAQAVASKLIHEHPTRCIAMSGICGGRREKVTLGDVIFADALWSYDAGKITVESGQQRFQGDTIQYRPLPVWIQRMQHMTIQPNTPWLLQRPALSLEHQEDWVLLRILAGDDPSQHSEFNTACPDWSKVLPQLWRKKWLEKPLVLTPGGRERAEELNLLYPHGLPEPDGFQIHVAPIATGAAVTEDGTIFSRLAESMRKVLGIEMEASALGALGEIHDIPVLVAKGVSDYGDDFKDDRYRKFAARAAAECLIALLRQAVDLLPDRDSGTASTGNDQGNTPPEITMDFPRDLIKVLAEMYPDVQSARSLWQRAGGKASEVENITRPQDLWQRLWQYSRQGASVRPGSLLQAALDDLPGNAILIRYLQR
ncbi:effector-associated domain EAD1-containing protein [Candidatus Methylospira mobilis]|uniref:phosphorylase family protein n=1 Tax=Candidatus Methylospira mobilis TaxID=1808979 RepID=UPI0028E59EE0|nr:effector-associated domain EAD1-containing protein [Candidatus Methylospira mobilis]WNV06457.1 effector-associated domain EAD1-containing protein [Candidatus Methylospira mobilis]